MPMMSTAGWVVHELGLAASIGGSLFGQAALEPALKNVNDPFERDQVSERAWNNFSWINLAGHVAFAAPWLVGRMMLDGSEAGPRARALTLAKDVLVGASLVSGVACFVIGKILSRKTKRGEGPEPVKAGQADEPESPVLEKVVSVLGAVNLAATTGVAAVTAVLAMESSESVRFAARSRCLP